mmetsp:Transcript_13632/g.34534  ORF Transcript_13632/g.34534 Transcript_13632/m.34534 type:complete len:234 (+) Transcript_13632:94-795(+)
MAKTRSSRSAVAGGLALGLAAAATTAFVAPHSGAAPGGAALRGSATAVEPFQAQPAQVVVEPERALNWASFASLMAALGLAAGVATTPVRAEEAPSAEAAPVAPAAAPAPAAQEAAPAAPAAAPAPAVQEQATISTFETGGSFAKGGRKKAKSDSIKAKKSKEISASVKNGPGVKTVQEEDGSKKKVIISPADERDEDELSLSRTNRPLLAALAIVPSSIFIVFWTLGSLEII